MSRTLPSVLARRRGLRATVASLAAAATVVAGVGTAAPASARRAASYDSAGLRHLRHCESGGNYRTNTGNGYYGAYQFSLSTWHGLGLKGRPNHASPMIQNEAVHKLAAKRGSRPWPVCGRGQNLHGAYPHIKKHKHKHK